MSKQDVKRLAADMVRDASLAERFTPQGDDPGRWVRQARVEGYELEPEEARALISSQHELSDDELEQVAGGWSGSGGGEGGGEGGGG